MQDPALHRLRQDCVLHKKGRPSASTYQLPHHPGLLDWGSFFSVGCSIRNLKTPWILSNKKHAASPGVV